MQVDNVRPLIFRPLRIPGLKSRLKVGGDPERIGRRVAQEGISEDFTLAVTCEVAGAAIFSLCEAPKQRGEW